MGPSAMNRPSPAPITKVAAAARELAEALAELARESERTPAAADVYDSIHPPPRTSRRRFAEICRSGQADGAAQESEAIIYSVIIVPIEASAGRDTGGEHALIQFSEDTGGKYYYASSLSQLDEAFRRISDELRLQYLLAYYPSQHESFSDFRRIQIDLASPPAGGPYQARYRAGYYTTKDSF